MGENSVETKEFSPWSQDFSLTISIAFYNFQQCLIVFGYLDSLTWNIVMSPVVKILRHVCDFCMYTVHYMKPRHESYSLNDLHRL